MANSDDEMDKQEQKKGGESRNDQKTSDGTTGDDHPPSRSRSSSASRGSRSSRKVHPSVVTAKYQPESRSRSRSPHNSNSESSDTPDDPMPVRQSGPSTSGGSSLGPWAPVEPCAVHTDTPRYEEPISPSDSSGPDTGRTVINMGPPRPGTADTVIQVEPMDNSSTGSETPRNEQQPMSTHEEQGAITEEKMEVTPSTVQSQEGPPTVSANPEVSPARNAFAGPQARQPERSDSQSTIRLGLPPPEEQHHGCC